MDSHRQNLEDLKAFEGGETDKHCPLEIDTTSKYWALPESKRTRKNKWWPFGPWYKTPFAMEMEVDSWFGGKKNQWELLGIQLSHKYPIQYFIREGFWNFKFFLLCETVWWRTTENWRKYVIRTFDPLNPELRNVIPQREWQDKDVIVEDFLYQVIIDYVEREECFETICWTGDAKTAAAADMIKEIYTFAKAGRSALQEKISMALSNAHDKKVPDNFEGNAYEYSYGEMIALEAELDRLDEKYLTWVVKHRKILWT